jgi:predicted phosphodiesterase
MAQQRRPDELLRETLDLVAKHGTVAAAARAAGISPGTLQHRFTDARSLLPDYVPGSSAPVDPMVREPLASFEEAWAQWARTIGMMRERYAGPADATKRIKKRGADALKSIKQKILVIPDLHAPFHDQELFAKMIARETDVDKAICIGDLSDSYSLSTFTQYRNVGFAEEWASVTLAMQTLSESFPTVEMVIGNHDARLEKRLRERLSEDQVEAVKYLAGGTLCPITALARKYPNVTVARHDVPGGETVDWFTTCGDAWLGHPEKYSRVSGAALRFLEDWLADHEVDLGLERYRLVVMGHTHTASIFPYRNRMLLVETGCLCLTQGYMLKPKIGGRPQVRGYLTFEQTNGRTDLNSVRFHWLDAEDEAA